jgi:hypothetical protein
VIISNLTGKCGGNVHGRGVVEITASSVFWTDYSPRNTADLGSYSFFFSQNEPGQWIYWNFRTLRIEPTQYTIQTSNDGSNWCHLKSWMVEGSDDGASGCLVIAQEM